MRTKGRSIGQSTKIKWNESPANAKGISQVNPTHIPIINNVIIFLDTYPILYNKKKMIGEDEPIIKAVHMI